MTCNVSREKSKKFAVRIVNLYKYLCNDKKEYVMSKQILKSGTSIGANLAEAEYAVSKNEFVSKLYISLKECNETVYWLELLHETNYLDEKLYNSIYSDCEEIRRILIASTKTIKRQTENNGRL